MQVSPLFSQFQDRAVALQVTQSGGTRHTIWDIAKWIQTGVEPQSDLYNLSVITNQVFPTGLTINHIDDAENFLLSYATFEEHEFYENPAEGQRTRMNLLNEIVRAGNRIAVKTRRGSGNVVLIGSDVLAEIRRLNEALAEKEPETLGRWTKVGYMFNCMQAYTGPAIAKDEIFVAYVGSLNLIDGPGGLIESQDELHLFENNSSMSKVCDFIRGFRVKLI